MAGRKGPTPKLHPFSKITTLSLEEVRKGIFYLTNKEWASIRKNVPLGKEPLTHGPGVLVCPHPSGDFHTALLACALKSGPDKLCVPQIRRTPEGCLEIVGCTCYDIDKPRQPDMPRPTLPDTKKPPCSLLIKPSPGVPFSCVNNGCSGRCRLTLQRDLRGFFLTCKCV